MTIHRRIKQLRDDLVLTQQSFSKLINSSKSYVSEIENGKLPSFNFIQSLLAYTNVDPKWLLTGEGEMYHQPTKRTPTVEEIDKNLKGLTEEQRQEILSRTGEMLLINAMRKDMEELKIALDRKPRSE